MPCFIKLPLNFKLNYRLWKSEIAESGGPINSKQTADLRIDILTYKHTPNLAFFANPNIDLTLFSSAFPKISGDSRTSRSGTPPDTRRDRVMIP
jgi:hypothetical protein